MGARGHGVGEQCVVVLFAEALEVVEGGADEVDCNGFSFGVRDVFLVDEESLTEEFISELLDSSVVTGSIDSLASLEIKFHC